MAEYNKLTPELIEELKGIVGEANCYVGDDISADIRMTKCLFMASKCPKRCACLQARLKLLQL